MARKTPPPKYDTNERERQKAAYNLLKLNGAKNLKPNFSDYSLRNRSLINRAEKLSRLTDVKQYTTKDEKKTSFYATYETEFNPGVDPSDAITTAQSMIDLYGRLFNRAQVSYKGMLIKSPKDVIAWRHGPMATKTTAVKVSAKMAMMCEYVLSVKVHFRKIAQ